MNRNRSIDGVRAIACVFVLFVHATLPGRFGVCVSAMARFAVPFFLLVSGYYAFRGEAQASVQAARRQLKNTAHLTLAGFILYAVSNTLCRVMTGGAPFEWLDSLLSPTGIRRFLIFNRAIFLSSVMYYLFMMLYVYALFILLLRTNTLRHAVRCIPLLLLLNLFLSFFFFQPWYYAGNFLLTGLPFFLLGYTAAQKKLRFPRAHWLIVPGLLLSCLESRYNAEMYCSFGTLMVTAGVFFTCLTHPQGRLPERLVRFGRECSMYLFLIHCAVRDHLKILLPQSLPLRDWLLPLLVLALSAAISVLLARRPRRA